MAFASLAFLSITPCKVMRIPSAYGIWNPCLLKSGIQLKESGIMLTIGFRNWNSTDKESRMLY